eukprot:6185733-Pleurochrysis_carterae.AAC.1
MAHNLRLRRGVQCLHSRELKRVVDNAPTGSGIQLQKLLLLHPQSTNCVRYCLCPQHVCAFKEASANVDLVLAVVAFQDHLLMASSDSCLSRYVACFGRKERLPRKEALVECAWNSSSIRSALLMPALP